MKNLKELKGRGRRKTDTSSLEILIIQSHCNKAAGGQAGENER